MKRNNVGTFMVAILQSKELYNVLMCVAGIVVALILSWIATGSDWFTGVYDDFFASVAFMESLLLTIFAWKKIKFKKDVKEFTFIWCTFISFAYATMRLTFFPNICSFEGFGTALLLIVNFAIL